MKMLMDKLQISKIKANAKFYAIKEETGSDSDSSGEELQYTGSSR